jgi:hypothetical protein
MIRRLAYVSRPRPNLALTEIPRIVAKCRTCNAVEGLTGVLLFTGVDFAQLIEGEPEAVSNVWFRIQADERHQNLVVILDERAPDRWFPDWRVGFPSDNVVVARIGAWREATRLGAAVERDDLRRVLAAADAL